MVNFIIGIIFGLAVFLLLAYIIGTIEDRRMKKEIGEDFETIIMTKSEMEKYIKYKEINKDK